MGKINKTNFNDDINAELDIIQTLQETIGNVSNLETENKELVGAINEVKNHGNSVKQQTVSSLLSVDIGLPISMNSTWRDIVEQTKNIQAGSAVINGIVEEYKVAAGENVSAGDFVQFVTGNTTITSSASQQAFNAVNTNYISTHKLSPTKVFVGYRDSTGDADDYGCAVILTIEGSSIIVGTPITYASVPTGFNSSVLLDENTVFMSYNDSDGYGTAIILTVDGTTITAGTPVVYNQVNMQYTSITKLDANRILVGYKDNTNDSYGTVVVLKVEGTTITKGTPVVFNQSTTTNYISFAVLSPTKVLIAYQSTSNYGRSIVITIDDLTITVGLNVVFENASTSHISAVALSEDRALVAFTDSGGGSYGTAIVLSVNGTTITKGSPFIYERANTTDNIVLALDPSRVLVCYTDNGNGQKGTAIMLTVNGTTITASTPIVFNEVKTSFIVLTQLTGTEILVSYKDNTNNFYGAATLLYVDATTIKKSTSSDTIHGVAQQSGIDGDIVPIITLS